MISTIVRGGYLNIWVWNVEGLAQRGQVVCGLLDSLVGNSYMLFFRGVVIILREGVFNVWKKSWFLDGRVVRF